MSRQHLTAMRELEDAEISALTALIFDRFLDDLYFEEFVWLTENVTSELYHAVISRLFEHIPCCQNYLVMRHSYFPIANFIFRREQLSDE